MKNSKEALSYLGKSIADLQIKDKALEQVIRHLIFQNDEDQILNTLRIYMPEFREQKIPEKIKDQEQLLVALAEQICPGRKYTIESESLKNCVLLNLEFKGSLFGLTIGIIDPKTLGAEDTPNKLRFYIDAEYSGLEHEAEELKYALAKAIKRMPDAFYQETFQDSDVKQQIEDLEFAQACASQKWQYII